MNDWWVEDDRPPLTVPRSEWRWHLFLRLDESVKPARVDEARQAARMSSAARIRLVTFAETDPAKMQTILRQPVRSF